MLPLLSVLIVLFVVMLLGSPRTARAAVQVDEMGTVRLWAKDSTAHQRNDVLSSALAQVIVRISGQQNSLTLGPVKQWLSRPADYLVSYVYEQPTQRDLDYRSVRALSASGLWLRLIFDYTSLAQTMRENGVPVWGRSRPRVMLWWGLDNDARRALIGREDQTGYASAFKQGAALRGIPLIFPKLDAEDQARVGGVAGVFGFAADPILQGSKRYAADAVLVGRAKRLGNQSWQASWQLLVNGESYWFEETAQSVEKLAERALISVAEQLSALYAVTTTFGENDQVDLRIIEVANHQTYVAVQRYLERLNVVSKVHLSQVRGEQLQYSIQLDGDVGQLQKALSLDGKLVATGNVPAAWVLPTTPAEQGIPAAEGAWGMPGAPSQAAPGDGIAVGTVTQPALEYYWVGP